ncbi:hypothetical protein LSO9J_10061 [Candidatus Liberibacter solanacearum]
MFYFSFYKAIFSPNNDNYIFFHGINKIIVDNINENNLFKNTHHYYKKVNYLYIFSKLCLHNKL